MNSCFCGNPVTRRKYCSNSCMNRASRNASYKRNRSAILARSRTYLKTRTWVRRMQAIEYKGGKCVDCGYYQNLAALEFDHTGTKTYKISTLLPNSAWSKIQKELDVCDLVCSNCHSIRTSERLNGRN